MATRSNIGMLMEQKTVKEIYCQFDGDPAHHGRILLRDYNSRDKAEQLISLGSIRVLGERIENCERYGEEPEVTSLEEYTNRAGDETWSEYFYLYDPSKGWMMREDDQHEWIDLKQAMVEFIVKGVLRDGSVAPVWHIDSAQFVDFESLDYARRVLELLPPYIFVPEVEITPKGHLTLTWQKEGFMICVRVRIRNKVVWMGLTPKGSFYGYETISSNISTHLLKTLEKYFSM